ncbi:phosphate acyltransferase PlsX [Luedemannella helvata]|uniref:phosphate acyltransferase PlsX n=1 Tax=Luedemannella helvata TaxID=349315 RepID=UPI0031E3AD59
MTRPAPGRTAGTRIAVDLLGGDDAPAVVVDGALRACQADPELQLLLVGPRRVADEVTAALDTSTRERVEVLVADQYVAMAEPAARGADHATTIAAAASAVAAGRAQGLVSAGASGATVTAAVIGIGRTPGFRRPALAAVLPGAAGPVLLLDVGAGMEVRPVDLVQHAVLGVGYARAILGVPAPRVGLLSVGSEPGKGDRLRRATERTLRTYPLPAQSRYVGLVEGDEVISGARADVVVTDGFTGNVLLKGVEAAIATAGGSGRHASVPSSSDAPRGAALLGVAGTVVVCHGAAGGGDIASGIALAAHLVRADMPRRIGSVSGSAKPAEVPW